MPGERIAGVTALSCPAPRWSYRSILMLHPSTKAAIDRWVNESPDFRRVESEPLANDAWESRALEDGAVLFEEVDLETDEPVLRLMAAWCNRQPRIDPRPLAKAGANANPDAPATRMGSKSR